MDVDEDWGSLSVEEDTQQSQSQDDEQAAGSQQQQSSQSSTAISEAHPQQSESAPSASSTIAPLAPPDSDGGVEPAAAFTSKSSSKQTVASRMALMRLQSDLKALEHDPPEGISASPLDPSNLLVWRACIFGPADTPWVSHTTQHTQQCSLPHHSIDGVTLIACVHHCCVRRIGGWSVSVAVGVSEGVSAEAATRPLPVQNVPSEWSALEGTPFPQPLPNAALVLSTHWQSRTSDTLVSVCCEMCRPQCSRMATSVLISPQTSGARCTLSAVCCRPSSRC